MLREKIRNRRDVYVYLTGNILYCYSIKYKGEKLAAKAGRNQVTKYLVCYV